jgi:hypothetical protein
MTIIAVKCMAVITLLAGFFWRATSNYQVLLHLAIWGAAIIVFVQAARAGKYVWMAAFLAVAALFNPILPVAISPTLFLTLNVLTAGLFMVSFKVLQSTPRLSLASITDSTSGAESL